jgi:hypothetical protein
MWLKKKRQYSSRTACLGAKLGEHCFQSSHKSFAVILIFTKHDIFYTVTVLDKNSIHNGSILLTNINTTAPFNHWLSRHTKQYLSEHSYSNFTISRVSQQFASTGLSRAVFSTQLKTTLFRSLSHCPLALDHKTTLLRNMYSLLVQTPLP